MRLDDVVLAAAILVVLGAPVLALITVARKWMEIEADLRRKRKEIMGRASVIDGPEVL
ncbi:MAG: hypothetical protein M3O20_02020 [Acidobacteriota bacterium]|nr:hypothetical protein [Acidobacteriota bacterium]